MKQINFLISGVMKGGTTSLYDFITLHPEINKAKQKEIHYFTLNYDKGNNWYEDFFEFNGRLNGEASPTYFDLADDIIIPNLIKAYNPEIKIIVILRDPVERAISHFNHFVKVNKVNELEELGIERFFNLPYSNAVAPSSSLFINLGHVLRFSCYYYKLNNYYSVFKENFMVIQNNELKNTPYETMSKIYHFLGVNKDFKDSSFEEIKYSAGTNRSQLSEMTINKLEEFFKDDQLLSQSLINIINERYTK